MDNISQKIVYECNFMLLFQENSKRFDRGISLWCWFIHYSCPSYDVFVWNGKERPLFLALVSDFSDLFDFVCGKTISYASALSSDSI